MNFVEAMELLQALVKFCPETSRIGPKTVLYDAEKKGYMVWVNEDSLKSDYLRFMKEIVETRQLITRKQKGYMVIQFC
jgi:hypothetical protein